MRGGLVGLDVVGLEVSPGTSVAGDLEGLEVSGLWLGDAVESLALFDWDHFELLVPSLDVEDFDPYAAKMRSAQLFKYFGSIKLHCRAVGD